MEKRIRELLEDEIHLSRQFQEDHLQLTGDGYPELCKELFRSSTLALLLQISVNKVMSNIPAWSTDATPCDNADDLQRRFMRHIDMFRIPMDMLY